MGQGQGCPPREGLSFIGKALGVMGVGVFVAAFFIELTEVIDRRRYRRAKAAARKAPTAARGNGDARPGSEDSDGGDETGTDRSL